MSGLSRGRIQHLLPWILTFARVPSAMDAQNGRPRAAQKLLFARVIFVRCDAEIVVVAFLWCGKTPRHREASRGIARHRVMKSSQVYGVMVMMVMMMMLLLMMMLVVVVLVLVMVMMMIEDQG